MPNRLIQIKRKGKSLVSPTVNSALGKSDTCFPIAGSGVTVIRATDLIKFE